MRGRCSNSEKNLAWALGFFQDEPRDQRMKARITITPKKSVLDPQGAAVRLALEQMGYKGIGAVHVGKYLEIDIEGDDPDAARKHIEEACYKFLSNPVIEDYQLELE